MGSGLSGLQERVLVALAGLEPSWTLTGGGALVGFHLRHRTTRDLDLFLHGRATLEDYAARVSERLRSAGMLTAPLQTGTSLHRMSVTCAGESIVLDLVADPVPVVEEPVEEVLGDVTVRVDTSHEILVNKLCALVQRSELRDLVDVKELLAHGGDLPRALSDAPRKDGGFSPLTLAWLLEEFPIESVGRSEGWSDGELSALDAFRASLVARLGELSRPDDG